MRAYSLIISLLCAIVLGAVGARTGFTYTISILFTLSLSAVAYAGLSAGSSSERLTVDRLLRF